MAGRLGERLKAARKQRGVALDEVHASTKIHKRYLEALERQDWDAFPGAVFARGYLRTYSEYLGLDPERMLKAFAREHAAANPGCDGDAEARKAARAVLVRLAESRGVELSLGRRIARVVAGVALLSLVAAGALWAALRLQDTGSPSELAAPTARVQQPPARPPEPAPLPVPANAVAEPARTDLAAGESSAADGLAQAAPSTPARLVVEQHGVGSGVANHQLIDPGDEFVEGSVVWFWTHVSGGRQGDRVEHVWIRDGRQIGETTPLRVAGAQWRTHSRRKMGVGAAGRWTVEARDAEGRLLASSSFDVVRRVP